MITVFQRLINGIQKIKNRNVLLLWSGKIDQGSYANMTDEAYKKLLYQFLEANPELIHHTRGVLVMLKENGKVPHAAARSRQIV